MYLASRGIGFVYMKQISWYNGARQGNFVKTDRRGFAGHQEESCRYIGGSGRSLWEIIYLRSRR
jgi:hypothetical protein